MKQPQLWLASALAAASLLSTTAAEPAPPGATTEWQWPSEPPADCPIAKSETLSGLVFTDRHAEYTDADTWYPSWASDGNLYSPWTDGVVNGLRSDSADKRTYPEATTGYATIIGDDPLDLKIEGHAIYPSAAAPYQSRYPAGSLVHNGIWYYGTYCLGGGQVTQHEGVTYNWPWLGPFVGFRYSKDFGKTWTQTPCTPEKPLFGEQSLKGEPVKIGAPHFVDFGKNMEHSPDGKAYLVAHGASDGVNRRFGYNSWITGDEVYLLRVTPTIENMNDPTKYEFFDGTGWTHDFKKIKPIVSWRDRMGCVTMTYNAPLKKYLMCVTDGMTTGRRYNTYILESDTITGPFKMVHYLKEFGEQGYFVNFPSKFISKDGKTLWLSYSGNFATDWDGHAVKKNPPSSRYAWCLHEVKLREPGDPPLREATLTSRAKVAASSTHKDYAVGGLTDGVVGGFPGDIANEWCSDGEREGAFVRLAWEAPVSIGKITLHDRPNDFDQVQAGLLVFSDGTTLPVGELADDGKTGTEISFAPKTVTWVAFFVTKVKPGTLNIGLAEMVVDNAAPPPTPFGPVPSAAQEKWHDMEMYAFVHFTTNTFTDKEWGYGDEDPKIFNPSAFDVDQIVGTLAKTGFKGVILTCKHHDGYCLWPTKTTGHNITKSPWKDGQGDMVKEFADAAKRHGIGFGVYLSPWDRNSEHYGTPRYVDIYREQLRELLTNYGPIFEVWHDGANGGDGYYGGKRETRSIDHRTYYEWPKAWELVRKLQPDAVIFSDVGPDLRWVGNEAGQANYPNWATFSPVGHDGGVAAPGFSRSQVGTPDGKVWIPAEADVSIRPGWFWHESENQRVRSPKNLLDLYFHSVGRGAGFLLNVPPDRRGLIHENDVIALTGFKQALDQMFSNNLAKGAKITADSNRGAGFEAEQVLDDDKKSYWAAPDDKRAATLELTLPEARKFSVIRLREPLSLGQRIRKFAVDVRENGAWHEWIGDGSSVGPHVLLRGKPVTADAVRVRITEAAACPCLSEISLWLEPADIPSSLAKADPKALSKDAWKATASFASTDYPAAQAVDGDPNTLWCTHDNVLGEKGPPQSLTVDLGASHDLAAVTVLPRQDGSADALVDLYRLEWSDDGAIWSQPLEGEFSNIRANPVEQRITLPDGTKARHIRFTALRVLAKNNVTVAELGAILK